ncbi:MAG TPA: SdrD B-like domain-containing protein [Desertimonas sp.]|nr:SdrD B-like domain-containing protein [Desertimonas sp.]
MYGLNGVRLELLDASGNVVATTTTANHPTTGKPGYYRFGVVCGAAYKVRVKASNFANGGVLDDYVLTVRNAAADNIDSDGNPLTNASHSVVVASGADLTVDFGFVSKKKECDKGDKYGHDRDKYGHDRDDCDRDDDRCDKDDKYGGHDRDKYGRDDDCRDHDRDDDDRDRCKDDHWNDGWGRNDRDYNDGHDRDKGGWH